MSEQSEPNKLNTDTSPIQTTYDDTSTLHVFDWDFVRQFMEQKLQVHPDYGHKIMVTELSYPIRSEHTHNYFEVMYILSGSCTYLINQKMELLCKGDLCILPPQARHSISPSNDSNILNIMIHPTFFTDVVPSFPYKPDLIGDFIISGIYRNEAEKYLLFHTDEDSIIHKLFLGMRYEMSHTDEYSDTVIAGMTVSLLAKLMRFNDEISTSSLSENRDNEILSIIHNNYSTITLAELAEHLHYTVPYCSKYLKEHLGTTFSALLKQIRLQKAEHFLTNSHMTITEISNAVGYENMENFVRAFKQAHKITPSQYRIKHSTPPHANRPKTNI